MGDTTRRLVILTAVFLIIQVWFFMHGRIKYAVEEDSQVREVKHLFANYVQSLSESKLKIERLSELVHSAPHIEAAAVTPPAREGRNFGSGNEDGACVGGRQAGVESAVAAVVSVTFDRPDYLYRHLDSLLGVHGLQDSNQREFPLYVSQDGPVPEEQTKQVALRFANQSVNYMHHKEEKVPEKLTKKESLAYYRIANHYKFILRTIFDCFGYDRLIIVEDDMEIAPDFFSYFKASSRILDQDPTLYCVSSWNDHGQRQFVRNETQLHRSDFFPGLGWMLNKQLWEEVRGEWPHSYWDDWMRLNKTRKGRQCIRPEVCRTYNFGALGSSKGQYFKRFLAPIRLSSSLTDWSKQDISYLLLPRYDDILQQALQGSQQAASIDDAIKLSGDVLVEYDSQEHYEALTGRLGLLREWKEGVPRGAYKGVVMVHYNEATIYIARAPNFRQPELSVNGSEFIRVDRTGALVRRSRHPKVAAGRQLKI